MQMFAWTTGRINDRPVTWWQNLQLPASVQVEEKRVGTGHSAPGSLLIGRLHAVDWILGRQRP